MPQIEVTFDIDANGIVNVTAKDMATGKEQKITISGSSGLNKDDVDRMVKDAEAHAAEDKARRELIDARNQADSLAYSVEKTLNENRDRLPAVDVERVERAIAVVREAVKGDDVAGDSRGERRAAEGVARDGRAALQAARRHGTAARRQGARTPSTTTSSRAKSSMRNVEADLQARLRRTNNDHYSIRSVS